MPSLSEETNGRIERLMPGATIGIIGGGQLGRMMALSARYMGFRIGVLDPTPDCPTAQVADFQVTAEYDDIAAIRELAEKSDVLTYEFENVDADAIDQVRSLAAAPQGTDLLRVTQDRVNEKRFINDHYAESDLSVERLCAHLHLSPAYFSTLFKREVGMSFTAYVTVVRMEAAATALRTTEEKTYLIARKCGYDDPNYFSYVFKRHFGVTPTKYRAGA